MACLNDCDKKLPTRCEIIKAHETLKDRGIVIVGASESGKSALFAQLAEALKAQAEFEELVLGIEKHSMVGCLSRNANDSLIDANRLSDVLTQCKDVKPVKKHPFEKYIGRPKRR